MIAKIHHGLILNHLWQGWADLFLGSHSILGMVNTVMYHLDAPTTKDLLPSLQGVWPSDSLQLTALESASAKENHLIQGHDLPGAALFSHWTKLEIYRPTLTWSNIDGQLLQSVPLHWPTFWHQLGFILCSTCFFPSFFHRCSSLINTLHPKVHRSTCFRRA